MRERLVEQRLTAAVQARGGLALKFVSPGQAGVPDRLVLLPVPPEHQELVARYVRFVEVKAPGRKLSRLQEWMQGVLRRLGFWASWVDRREAVEEMLP